MRLPRAAPGGRRRRNHVYHRPTAQRQEQVGVNRERSAALSAQIPPVRAPRAIRAQHYRYMEARRKSLHPGEGHQRPTFHHGRGGTREVHPGNEGIHHGGDHRPPRGGGGRPGGRLPTKAAARTICRFELSRKSSRTSFEDLALPNLVAPSWAEIQRRHARRLHQRRHARNISILRCCAGHRAAHRHWRQPRASCARRKASWTSAAGAAGAATRRPARVRERSGRNSSCAKNQQYPVSGPISTCATTTASRVPKPTSQAVMFC